MSRFCTLSTKVFRRTNRHFLPTPMLIFNGLDVALTTLFSGCVFRNCFRYLLPATSHKPTLCWRCFTVCASALLAVCTRDLPLLPLVSCWHLISPPLQKTGGVYRGGYVCFEGTTYPRDARGLRDVRREGHEEGQRHEHVDPQALEVVGSMVFSSLCLSSSFFYAAVQRMDIVIPHGGAFVYSMHGSSALAQGKLDMPWYRKLHAPHPPSPCLIPRQ